ncbi:hypothetical protein SLA2020_139310 [Shorea laevis]
MSSSRFYPYFKYCVGAIDGTHIRVKVSSLDASKYHGRKEYPTQNVLASYLIAEVDMELRNQDNSQQTHTSREEEEDTTRGEMLRDVIAADMWHNYKSC